MTKEPTKKTRTTAASRAEAAIHKAAEEVLTRSRVPLPVRIRIATDVDNMATMLTDLAAQAFPVGGDL